MAHLEGAYEQINERLGMLEADVREVRSEVAGVRTAVAGVRSEVAGLRSEFLPVLADRTNDLRRELFSHMNRQFFWLLGLLIVSIFLPIARSLGR
jgi:hypothetical protein